jgi:two-component system cell cycle response regulator
MSVARILIIEDNPGNLELMTYLLGAFGHSTLTAGNGDHGIQMVRREKPDLVLCDIHLPGADGYAVARELKRDAALKRIPIVAVSALVMVGDREKGMAAGFDGYISKPIDPMDFVGQVDRFLRMEQRSVAPRQQAAEAVTAPAAEPSNNARVVVVDDSPTNRELIYQTLTPSGYQVIATDNVQAALHLVRTRAPDLILSDLHMPGEDGFHFVRAIKADSRLAAIPFIFISSSVWGERERHIALQLGVTRFLLRPIEPQALLAEIAASLKKTGARRGDDPGGR